MHISKKSAMTRIFLIAAALNNTALSVQNKVAYQAELINSLQKQSVTQRIKTLAVIA